MEFEEQYIKTYFESIEYLEKRRQATNNWILTIITRVIMGLLTLIVTSSIKKINVTEGKHILIALFIVLIYAIVWIMMSAFMINRKLSHRISCKYKAISEYISTEKNSSVEIYDFYKKEQEFYKGFSSTSRSERNIYWAVGVILIVMFSMIGIILYNLLFI